MFSAATLADLAAALGADPRAADADPPSTDFVLGDAGVRVAAPVPAAIHQCAIDLAAYDEDCWPLLGVAPVDTLQKAVRKRRGEFLAGRYCARRALAGVGRADGAVGRGEGGSPVWPHGIAGSISHHGGVAIAAVTTASVRGVGIDVQSIVSARTMGEIGRAILHGEDATLMAAWGAQPELAFTAIFSIKESFFKAAYPSVRRYFDFNVAEILSLDLQRHRFRLRLRTSLDDALLRAGTTFDGRVVVQDDWVVSLLVFGAG